MTKQQREKLKRLKSELSFPKSRLISLLQDIESISPAQGEKLARIIARLEDFQNA